MSGGRQVGGWGGEMGTGSPIIDRFAGAVEDSAKHVTGDRRAQHLCTAWHSMAQHAHEHNRHMDATAHLGKAQQKHAAHPCSSLQHAATPMLHMQPALRSPLIHPRLHGHTHVARELQGCPHAVDARRPFKNLHYCPVAVHFQHLPTPGAAVSQPQQNNLGILRLLQRGEGRRGIVHEQRACKIAR